MRRRCDPRCSSRARAARSRLWRGAPFLPCRICRQSTNSFVPILELLEGLLLNGTVQTSSACFASYLNGAVQTHANCEDFQRLNPPLQFSLKTCHKSSLWPSSLSWYPIHSIWRPPVAHMIMTNALPQFLTWSLPVGNVIGSFLMQRQMNFSQSQSEQFMLPVVRFLLLVALLVVTFHEFNSITSCLGIKVGTIVSFNTSCSLVD